MHYPDRPVLLQRTAPFTNILLAINIGVYLLLELSGGSSNPWVLLRYGAKFAPLIRAGEPWRLLTSMFLHSGLLHLSMNSFSLHNLGNVTERLFGSKRFLLAYLASGLCGSIVSTLLADPRVIGVGASGAIFGLAGCLFYFGLRFPRHFALIAGMRFVFIVLLNLAIGFTSPLIDNYAHLGGLISGFAAAYALGLPGERTGESRQLARRVFLSLMLIGAAAAAWPVPLR
ncbi:MAG: rhomboid family intramembrane serine protease [Firmicutes bacterium]|nr:rhomboid family intramembrane serine protease [Bacillota bacterium]